MMMCSRRRYALHLLLIPLSLICSEYNGECNVQVSVPNIQLLERLKQLFEIFTKTIIVVSNHHYMIIDAMQCSLFSFLHVGVHPRPLASLFLIIKFILVSFSWLRQKRRWGFPWKTGKAATAGDIDFQKHMTKLPVSSFRIFGWNLYFGVVTFCDFLWLFWLKVLLVVLLWLVEGLSPLLRTKTSIFFFSFSL